MGSRVSGSVYPATPFSIIHVPFALGTNVFRHVLPCTQGGEYLL